VEKQAIELWGFQPDAAVLGVVPPPTLTLVFSETLLEFATGASLSGIFGEVANTRF